MRRGGGHTTLPAAANVGIAAAYQDWEGCSGSLLQLAVNTSAIVVAGSTVLYMQRLPYKRRRRRHIEEEGGRELMPARELVS